MKLYQLPFGSLSLVVLIILNSLTCFTDAVFCQEQPTVQSSITCKRGDENVSSAAPISYRKGDQSIIVCKSADPHLELVAGENTRGVVRRSDHNNRILGIWLKDIDSSVRMVSTGGNYDRRLDFVGMCYAMS